MSHDKMLEKIRERVTAVLISKSNGTLLDDEAGELAELVEQLDLALSNGGNLPAAWKGKPFDS